MVVMLHNTDIPDGWEREPEDPEYLYGFSPDAYAVGIDFVLYAMTTEEGHRPVGPLAGPGVVNVDPSAQKSPRAASGLRLARVI